LDFYQDKLKLAEKIIDHSFEGILVTDLEGIIQKVNSPFSKITGYSPEDVKGKTPSVLQSGEHSNDFYKNMWESLQQNGIWKGEIWNKRKNGESYKENLTITAIKNEAGETQNYVGMFREIQSKGE
jgi:NNP family nitrate/nitrite transporter-like MFS transporter